MKILQQVLGVLALAVTAFVVNRLGGDGVLYAIDPFTLAMLGVAGANAVSGAVSGGKQDDIAQQSLALETARENDRTKLRDMFMNRITGGPNPEQSVYDANTQAANVFGAGDPNAAGRGNPFANPMAAPSGERPAGTQEPGWQVDVNFPEGWAEDQGIRPWGDQLPPGWWPTDENGNPVSTGMENSDFDPLNPTAGLPQGSESWTEEQWNAFDAWRMGEGGNVSGEGFPGFGGGPNTDTPPGAPPAPAPAPAPAPNPAAPAPAPTPAPAPAPFNPAELPPMFPPAPATSPPPERDARSTGSWLNRIMGGMR